jgi:urea carboxylase
MRAEASAGRIMLDIEAGEFRRATHHAFLTEHARSIAAFRVRREQAFATERAAWEHAGEFARVNELTAAALATPVDDGALGVLPDGAVVVESSLQACVWRVHVREGQTVAPGEHVVTVEAMKMETAITAPTGGVVQQVVCKEGQMVAPGAPLLVLVADD